MSDLTPQELARQSDRLAFAAEGRRIRERAYELIAQRRSEYEGRVARCLGHTNFRGLPVPHIPFVGFYPKRPPKPPAKRKGRELATVSFRGETHPLSVWAERTGLTSSIIRTRLHAGWDAERIFTTAPGGCMGRPRSHRSGVGNDLPADLGTGGGSVPLHFSQLEISK